MPAPERKPAVAMQSREPHSIRFTPDEWTAITEAALCRGLEPAVFTRSLAMYALRIADAPVVREASLGIPREMLAGSQRTRRF